MFCYSLFQSGKKMLKIQAAEVILNIAKNIMLGGYSGAMVQVFALLRNYFGSRETKSKTIFLFLILGQVTLGYLVNNKGLIGYLPILASTSFTATIMLTNKAQHLRLALIANGLLWFSYYVILKDYPTMVSGVIAILFNIISIFKGDRD